MRHLGNNYRMSDINAALGISQLRKINKFIKKRKYISNFYNKIFSKNNKFIIPNTNKNYQHSYHLYPLLVRFDMLKKSRKKVFKEFLKHNIKLQVHYIPVNFQPYYKKIQKFDKNKFKNSMFFYKSQISLPIYYDLSLKQLIFLKKICKKIFKI